MKELDGLATFYSWHHALRAEKVLGRLGMEVALIPGPREISSNCGTALRFDYQRLQSVQEVLAKSRVQVEAFHRYVPELEGSRMSSNQPRPFTSPGPRTWLGKAKL